MEQSKTRTIRTAMCLIQKPTIGKTALSFLMLTALTLFTACQTTQTDEPKWNDFYEVRTYDIHTEVVTNEIVTIVFIQKFVETNKVVKVAEPATDFGGYEFAPLVPATNYFVDIEVPSGHTQIEFQCVDGSCAK